MKKILLSTIALISISTGSLFAEEDPTVTKALIKVIEKNKQMEKSINDLYKSVQDQEGRNSSALSLVSQLDEKIKEIDKKSLSSFKSNEEVSAFKGKTEDTIRRMEEAISIIQDLKRLTDGSVANAISGPLATIQKMLDQRLSAIESDVSNLKTKPCNTATDAKIINFVKSK